MFSAHHHAAWEQVADLRGHPAAPLDNLRPLLASDFAPLLWDKQFGCGGSLDRAILGRSAELKSALYGGRLFVIVPIYVSSICSEQCVYCNYRAGNNGLSIERRRLSDSELEQEAQYLVEQKGQRVLELVYASDPRMRVDSMCRHVELLRRVLDRRGGGLVAISAEALEENEYRLLVDAGLSISVLWQETYDKSRYPLLHPGKLGIVVLVFLFRHLLCSFHVFEKTRRVGFTDQAAEQNVDDISDAFLGRRGHIHEGRFSHLLAVS